jgi:hypothetical protein
MAQIDDGLLIARAIPIGSQNGFSATLVSNFGSMISEVEELFGPRNHDYTILGVEFSGTIPGIWFPRDCKHIAIQLGKPAMMDFNKAHFQLAHETVHLLDPVVGGTQNVLEEGLATFYQLRYIHRLDPNYFTGDAKYDAACMFALRLMAESPNAIKTLRAQGQTISALTAQQLRGAGVGLTNDEANILALPFQGWTPP